MLSPIDYYLPTDADLDAIETEQYIHQQENDRLNGEWEAITAPYGDIADKSPEWWEGFLTALAQRNGVNVAIFQQAPCFADEF